MSRFSCLGPSCEANCCNTWTIAVDKAHYDRQKQAMSGTPEARREFDANVKRVKGPTRSKYRYALIVLNDDDLCGFLTPSKTCGMQERYGGDVLADTCMQYPRLISVSGERYELAGSTSCPEVARQLLLHDDALELDEVDPALLSRRMIRQHIPDHPANPYLRYHDEIRNLMLDVLSDVRFDLGTRLSLVAYFADRTRPFLHRESTVLDEPRLLAECERLMDPAQRALLASEFRKIAPPPSLAVRIAMGFLVQPSVLPLYEALRHDVLRGYAPSLAGMEAVTLDTLERVGDEILARYEERKVRFAAFKPRIDAYLTNFAKNVWVRQWYQKSPNLLMYTMELLVLLAAIRFLLLGHPLLAEFAPPFGDAHEATFDRAVVDAVFRFSRAFEHSPMLLEKMREDLVKNQAVTLAHAVSLARF